jgi:hypothetical protein
MDRLTKEGKVSVCPFEPEDYDYLCFLTSMSTMR